MSVMTRRDKAKNDLGDEGSSLRLSQEERALACNAADAFGEYSTINEKCHPKRVATRKRETIKKGLREHRQKRYLLRLERLR